MQQQIDEYSIADNHDMNIANRRHQLAVNK